MFGLPGPLDFILTLIVLGLGVFSFVTMVVVFQASLAAKEYFERKNHEHITRPVQRRA